jgi:arsenite-transporting ATPase
VVGKGGVGKTTCAAALALHASRTAKTLVISTDPAQALPLVLPAPPRGLTVEALDATARRAAFMDKWGTVIRAILDRGTYLDDADIGPLVDTALPGGDEIFAALRLAELFESQSREPRPESRLFIDTAPTGHTLRLLDLPGTFRALVHLLDAMQAKHRFMVRTLMRRYKADDADAFLAEMGELVGVLESTLTDPRRCAALMVTNGQKLVQAETGRYLAELARRKVRVAAIVWNNSDAITAASETPQYRVQRLTDWPVGIAGLERWLSAVRA